MSTAFAAGLEYFQSITIPRMIELISAPRLEKEILWIAVPLAITLLLIQMYFGRHRDEELGWNTAYGNMIALLFVSANLLKHLYDTYPLPSLFDISTDQFWRLIAVIAVASIAVILMFADFLHALSKRLAFFFSNSVVLTTVAYSAIVVVHTDVAMDFHTLVAIMLLFVCVFLISLFIKNIIPPSQEAQRSIHRRAIEKTRILQQKKKMIIRNVKNLGEKIDSKFTRKTS